MGTVTKIRSQIIEYQERIKAAFSEEVIPLGGKEGRNYAGKVEVRHWKHQTINIPTPKNYHSIRDALGF